MAVVILSSAKLPITKNTQYGVGYITQESKEYKSKFLGCTRENYDEEFNRIFSLRNNARTNNRTFYHIKQTFAPEDNISLEKAFEIGTQLADHYYTKGFQTVITTHKDTKNIHNHIIFNAVSSHDFSSFRGDKKALSELQNINDEILRTNNLLTREELKERKKEYQTESAEENGLQKKSVQLHKEIIVNAINNIVQNKKADNIYSFQDILKKEFGINSQIRGRSITFEIDGRKYRSTSLSTQYSLDNIEKKLRGKYTQKDNLESLILDGIEQSLSMEDFITYCKKNGISTERQEEELIFHSEGRHRTNLSKLAKINYSSLEERLNTKSFRETLKKDILKLTRNGSISSIEDLILHLDQKEYIEGVKLQSNTLIVETSSGKIDVRSLGWGSEEKNRFTLKNIKTQMFISSTSEEIKKRIAKKEILSGEDLQKFFYSMDLPTRFSKGKLYIEYDGMLINQNRFISLDKELRDNEFKSFFRSLNKVTNFDELEKLGVTKTETGYLYLGKPLDKIKFNKNLLNQEGLLDLMEYNKYQSVLQNAKTFDELKEKLNLQNITFDFDAEEVQKFFEEKKFKSDVFKCIYQSTNLKELETKIASRGYSFEQDKDYFYFHNEFEGDSKYCRVKFNTISNILQKNLILRTSFEALKRSITIEQFLQKCGNDAKFVGENYQANNMDLTKLNFISNDGSPLFCKTNITERIFQNHDYVKGTKFSLKEQFKEEYFNALKNSNSLEEFKEALNKSKRFSYTFQDEDIIFTTLSGEKINSKHYNFKQSNFFSKSFVEQYMREKQARRINSQSNFLLGKAMRLLFTKERARENRRGLTGDDMKNLRIKREMRDRGIE